MNQLTSKAPFFFHRNNFSISVDYEMRNLRVFVTHYILAGPRMVLRGFSEFILKVRNRNFLHSEGLCVMLHFAELLELRSVKCESFYVLANGTCANLGVTFSLC